MSDLNDLSRPVTTDTEPNVLDTLRAHIARAATWAWSATANKVAGLMSASTAAVSGGRSLRLYRRNDANTADEEVVSLPAISVGGNAATASAAQAGSALESALAAKAPLNSPNLTGIPTTPTAAAGTNTTQMASTAFAVGEVSGLRGSAPAALNTLEKLAAALGNDASFASSTNTALANRIVKKSAARPGVDRIYRNDSDTDYSGQLTWQADKTGFWSFRGYAGDTYHAPVYVGYAGYADAAGAVAWGNVTGKPTTVAGFGITDMGNQSVNYAASAGAVTWGNVSGKPTTVAGYGITDMGSQSVNYAASAGAVANGVYSIGNQTVDGIKTFLETIQISSGYSGGFAKGIFVNNTGGGYGTGAYVNVGLRGITAGGVEVYDTGDYGAAVRLTANRPGASDGDRRFVAFEVLSTGVARAAVPNSQTVLLSAYFVRAWVKLRMSDGVILGAGNVSSITRYGAGRHRVNFATNVIDANYSVFSSVETGEDAAVISCNYRSPDATGVEINTKFSTSQNFGFSDYTTLSVVIVR